MKRALTILSAILLFANSLFAQLDSIFDQGTYRTYIMHLPTGYSTINEYPIVLNLHGLLSNATLQQSITEFDSIADIKGFIVVYPNAAHFFSHFSYFSFMVTAQWKAAAG